MNAKKKMATLRGRQVKRLGANLSGDRFPLHGRIWPGLAGPQYACFKM